MKMSRGLVAVPVLLLACTPDPGAKTPAGVTSQATAPFCDAVTRFVASAKEDPQFGSTRGDAMLDYLWHTKNKPEGASYCTVQARTSEVGDATILCGFNSGSDVTARFVELTKRTQECLGAGGDWKASTDDTPNAAAWTSNANQVKVSVYPLPQPADAQTVVVLDFDPWNTTASATPSTPPSPLSTQTMPTPQAAPTNPSPPTSASTPGSPAPSATP